MLIELTIAQLDELFNTSLESIEAELQQVANQ